MSATLKVGDRIRDNDPRMRGRILVIADIMHLPGIPARVFAYVPFRPDGRMTGIRPDRVHTDGNPRKSGFSLVKDDHV